MPAQTGPATLPTPRRACCTPIIRPNSCRSVRWLTSADVAGNSSAVPSGNSIWNKRNIGTALLFPATSALVSHRTDRHEFGLMMGVQQALRGVASVAGPVWAGIAYQHVGPSVPFYACAVIIACALLLATRVPVGVPVTAAA